MKVYFIGAGPGDPELMTVKARRLISECPVCIYAGSLVSPAVVELVRPDAELHDSAKLGLDQMVAIFEGALRRNLDVARIHSGDTAIYSAIGEQIIRLEELGIAYEVVPGVSSFQAASAALGVELTAPGASQTIILTRKSGRTPVPEPEELENLARSKASLCLFLSISMLDETIEILLPHYGENCPVAIIFRVSWPDERIVRGRLKNISKRWTELGPGVEKTAMIIVGPSLDGPQERSKLYDETFSHEYRKASR